jgi:hypothetical protein
MMQKIASVVIVLLALGACGDSASPKVNDARNIDAAAISTDAAVCQSQVAPSVVLIDNALNLGTISDFSTADCIDHPNATATIVDSAGNVSTVSFRYPVTVVGSLRTVSPGTYDQQITLRVTRKPDRIVNGRVIVRRWTESTFPARHDVDISVEFTDPNLTIAPFAITGSYCSWLSLLC